MAKHLSFIPVGAIHHATFLKQSPPIDGDDYRKFLRAEFKNIRSVGLNTFNMECGWADMEVAEGEWSFTRTDIVKELCSEIKLKMLIWIWPELTPAWFSRKYPQCSAVAASGYQSQSHSYAHPLAQERCRAFIHAVVRRYGNSPEVIGYNIGIESGLHWNRRPDSSAYESSLFDYNAAAIKDYRRWLQKKYRDIVALNRYHRAHWKSFEEVDPPRTRSLLDQFMLVNHMEWLDWRLYTCDMMTSYIHFKAACVREIDPHRPIGDHSHMCDPTRGSHDLYGIARGVDTVGTSLFTENSPGDHMYANLKMDRHRSSGKAKPFWIWELRAGQSACGVSGWSDFLTGADIARFTWQALGQGAKSIQYWNWRPHMGGVEVGGHGLVSREGSLTDRARRAGEIAKVVAKNAEFILSLRPAPAEIAILETPKSQIIAAGEGSDGQLLESLRGTYSALKSQGFPIDFVSDAEVLAGVLDNYKMLCLPFAYLLDKEVAAAIASWVREGGYLFAGMWCAMKDGFGFGQDIVPGLGLDAVFGSREARLDCISSRATETVRDTVAKWDIFMGGPDILNKENILARGRTEMRVGLPLSEQGLLIRGDVLYGYQYKSIQAVKPGARVIAAFDTEEPAVVLNKYGKGAGLLFGSFPARENDFADDGLAHLLGDFAHLAGVTAPVTVQGRGSRQIEAKLLVDEQSALLVILNSEHESREVVATLARTDFGKASDFLTGAELMFRPGDHPHMSISVPARDVRVVKLTGLG